MSQPIVKQDAGKIKEEIKRAEAYPLIGYTVWWSMQKFRIDHAKFIEMMARSNFDQKYVKEASDKSVLTQVMRERTKGSRNQYYRKAVDDSTRTGFTITDTQVDQQTLDTQYQTITRAVILKESKALKVEGIGKQEIEETFSSFKGTVTTDQFRNSLIRFLEKTCNSVSIRDRGGVYFVPVAHKNEIESIRKLFAEIGGCELEALPVPDLDEAKKSMWKALVLDTHKEIADLQEELSNMSAPSQRVLQNRILRIQEINTKVSLYSDLMQGTAVELSDTMKVLQDKLMEKMGQLPEGDNG